MAADSRSKPSQSDARLIVTSPWEARRQLALCDDDRCPWKHSGVTAIAAHAKAEDHVRDTGHNVTIYHEERRRVYAR